jgi:hypothetical protein
MQYRLIIFSVAVWSLQALPAMCISGLIKHACAPHEKTETESPCHENEHENDHDSDKAPGGCGHEPDCSQDPCSSLTVRHERSETYQDIDAIIFVDAIQTTVNLDVPWRDGPPEHVAASTRPFLLHLTCPQGVLPLII